MNYEFSFELSPGKFVYIPTNQSKKRGRRICRQVRRRWKPEAIFCHLRGRKGHLGALRHHLGREYFACLDLQNFFSGVSRTKVARALKSIGFSNKVAFGIAYDSTVVENTKKILPYGFVQSMLLATLALEKSALGTALTRYRPTNIAATVYVDDIILSADYEQQLIDYSRQLCEAAQASGFIFNRAKTQNPATQITAFNCKLQRHQTSIEPSRYQRFQEQLVGANKESTEGIFRYVDAVNPEQAASLAL